jgi:hypothetical protein
MTASSESLTPFDCLRPCSNHLRVRPSDLRDYRMSHQMRGPGCFCPMMDENQPDFVEAAIYVLSVAGTPFSGEYVASCVRNQCQYFGK